MKKLRLTLLVGTVAGALPLTAAMAQSAGAPANAPSQPTLLLAQADTPPVPPEVLQHKKKEIEEKVSPRGRERGGEEGGGREGSRGERPSRAERPSRGGSDEAAPQRRAAPSEESAPAPRAERPSRGDAADEMKRRSRSSDEERAPKRTEAAPEPKPDASESSPKTLKVPEEKPAARSSNSEERKARQSDREERRQRRDEDRKATDTERKAPAAAPTTEEKTDTEKSTTSDEDKATIRRRSTQETAPEEKPTDKATETERQLRGTGGTTEDTDARDRDIRERGLRDSDRTDRDRADRDRDRGDRDRNARDDDIRDEADYRDRNRDFDRRFERREEREGDRVVIREKGDRTIIREGDRTIIRHDEDDRLRRFGHDVRTERRGDETVTIINRPNGVQIVTYTDRDGRLLRRVRRDHGRDIVLIDNRYDRPDYDVYVELPPVRLDIPEDEYIVEADRASYDDIRGALIAPPVAPIEQSYTLDQVRRSVSLRERVRSVDLNTINFAFGDWHVPDSQVDQLDNIAKALKAIIDDNPDEVFLIEGHTDAVGSEIDNLSLSDRRAEEVAAALTQDYQIPPENLVTQGYGEQYLKVDTEEANAENRRVVVRRITPLLKANAER